MVLKCARKEVELQNILCPAGGDGGPDRAQHQAVVQLRGTGQGEHGESGHISTESTQGNVIYCPLKEITHSAQTH